jgi:hypothetical protein
MARVFFLSSSFRDGDRCLEGLYIHLIKSCKDKVHSIDAKQIKAKSSQIIDFNRLKAYHEGP